MGADISTVAAVLAVVGTEGCWDESPWMRKTGNPGAGLSASWVGDRVD